MNSRLETRELTQLTREFTYRTCEITGLCLLGGMQYIADVSNVPVDHLCTAVDHLFTAEQMAT